MNTRIFTGYLPKDAEECFSPAAAGVPAMRKLTFTCIIKDSDGHEFPEPCVIEDQQIINATKPILGAGKPVIIEGEQTATEWIERGVSKGWRRRVRVRRIEILNRARIEKTEETPV